MTEASRDSDLARNGADYSRLVQIAERIPFVCEQPMRQELAGEFNKLAGTDLAVEQIVESSLAEGSENFVKRVLRTAD